MRVGNDTAQYFTSIVRIISKIAATHRELPTAKAVVDYCNRYIEVVGSPTNTQTIKWNGTAWVPADDLGGPAYSGGTGIDVTGTVIANTGDTNSADDITNSTVASGDLTGTYPAPAVARLQGRAVSATAPATDQVLKWNGTAWTPAADGGSAEVTTNGTLSGLGTSGSPLQIAQQGAVSGSVLRWTGSTWVPTALTTLFESGSFANFVMENNEAMNAGIQINTNAAGIFVTNPNLGGGAGLSGSLTGNRIEATATNLSSTTQVSDSVAYSTLKAIGTASNTHRQLGMFSRRRLLDTSTPNYLENEYKTSTATWRQRLVFPDRELNLNYTMPEYSGEVVMASSTINPSLGQVIKWDGANYVPSSDATGTAYTAGAGISLAGDIVTNTGDTNASDDLTTASTAAGDVTGLFSNLQIAANAVGTAEIEDGSIGLFDMSQDGAVEGDVRMWSGSEWFNAPVLRSSGLNNSPTITLNNLGGNAFSASIAQQGANPGNSLIWSDSDGRYKPDLSVSSNGDGLFEFTKSGQYGNIGYYGLNACGIEFLQDNGGFVSLVSNGTSYFNKIHGGNASEGSFNIFFDTLTTSLITSGNDKHHLTMLVSETRAHLVHRYQPGTTPYEHKILFGDYATNLTYKMPSYGGEVVLKNTTSPSPGNVLAWDGTAWAPTAPSSGGVTTVGATIVAPNADGATITSNTIAMHRADDINPGVLRLAGDLDGNYNAPLVDGIQGRNVSNTAPKIGQSYRWNGTAFVPSSGDFSGGFSFSEDFLLTGVPSVFFNNSNSGTGAGSSVVDVTTENEIGGTLVQTTGTTATGSNRVSTRNGFTLGQGEATYGAYNVRVPTLSTATERFNFSTGFTDGQSAPATIDGVYFLYNEAQSGNWIAVCESNNAITSSQGSSPVAVVAGTAYDLRIEVDAAGTEAKFYINGTLLTTLVNNIPVTIARVTGIGSSIAKTVGTTARTVTTDLVIASIGIIR